MIFYYQALNKSGDNVSDYIDAPSETTAKHKIRSQGLYLVKIHKHNVDDSDNQKKKSLTKTIYDKISNLISIRMSSRQLGLFSRQLSTLLTAGVPLIQAIVNIIDQMDNVHFRNIITDIKEKIEEGSSFSNALLRHRDIFSDLYISMTRVGENLGSLEHVLERLADMEDKKSILKNKIQAAMYYPLFMLIFAIIVVIFLMINVIPNISEMFVEQKKELPLPTEIVIWFSDVLTRFWFMIPVLVLVAIYMHKRIIKTDEGKKKFDNSKLKIPLVKNLYKKIIVYRFTQNLGILLNNKIDIIKSFEIVEKIVNNRVIEEKISDAGKLIKEGSKISNALNKAGFLPKMVLGMISAGEASDKLDTMLLNIGKVYENEIDLTITSLTSLLEPVIIIIMGILIGTIVMAVMLPMMEMNLLIQ